MITLVLLVHLVAALVGGRLTPAGPMRAARAAHTATVLADGRVLIAGGVAGSEGAIAGAGLFDPATGTFAPAGAMRIPRQSHTATRLADGRVLLAGGYDAAGRYLADAELYDPVRRTFQPAGRADEGDFDGAAASLRDAAAGLASCASAPGVAEEMVDLRREAERLQQRLYRASDRKYYSALAMANRDSKADYARRVSRGRPQNP